MTRRPIRTLFGASVLALAAGCAQPPGVNEKPDAPAEGPAERALGAGLRAYDEAQYPQAEKLLQQALATGLATSRDKAAAHKHLAFIYCTSSRMTECEAQFRSARVADPAFALSRSEAGHPLWGPVWQRVQR